MVILQESEISVLDEAMPKKNVHYWIVTRYPGTSSTTVPEPGIMELVSSTHKKKYY